MRTPGGEVVRGRWGSLLAGGGLSEAFPVICVAVLVWCTALGLRSVRRFSLPQGLSKHRLTGDGRNIK